MLALLLALWPAPMGAQAILPALLAPNFVLILADDQRWDAVADVHGLGGPAMPVVNAELAGSGITFTNAFVSDPVCAPSRASILSGKYAHNHGVLRNEGEDGGAQFFDDTLTLATVLRTAGYRTGLVGKYINGYESLAPYVPPGWTDWHTFVKPNYYNYRLVDDGAIHTHSSDYSTDTLAGLAKRFIAAASPGPFFLLFAPYAPHAPATPAPRDDGAFAGLPDWSPPSYNEANVTDKPTWIRDVRKITGSGKQQLKDFEQDQLESALAIDEAVGGILDALRAARVERDTVVIYMADNGLLWGEHRLAIKHAAFDESARVPLIVKYPALSAKSGTDDHLISNVDIPATIADLAGVPMITNGMPMTPILDGTVHSWRNTLLLEQWQELDDAELVRPPTWTAVRTTQYLYVDYADDAQGTELYDLALDSYALDNVTGSPGYAGVKADLALRLDILRNQ